MKKLIILLTFIGFSAGSYAQELNCNVTIVSDQINAQQAAEKQIFVDMKIAISDFMNNRRWTNDIFSQEERIKCNLIITFTKSPQQNVFLGNAQFQVIRPVYNTTYQTLLLTYVDRNFNVSFSPEDRQMIFNEQNFSNNLTSILGFYAMVALTLDYDSFSKTGGDQFLARAYNIANMAASAGQSGWEQTGDVRNRYWLIENLQNQQLLPFREGFYTYHRLALDNFANDPATGRRQILEFLNSIKTIQQSRTNSVLMNSFMDAKGQELVNVFSEASKDEKQKAFQVLSSVDPSKTELYRKLVK
ncbi:type IX secretion system protein PorD [Emticicia sp. 17c]|uniref:type IX secretion system protein PorD n=1 Tax=Emticicia sp. 17c TaxID=3127704 RepID=UPI00301E0631